MKNPFTKTSAKIAATLALMTGLWGGAVRTGINTVKEGMAARDAEAELFNLTFGQENPDTEKMRQVQEEIRKHNSNEAANGMVSCMALAETGLAGFATAELMARRRKEKEAAKKSTAPSK